MVDLDVPIKTDLQTVRLPQQIAAGILFWEDS